MEKKLSKGELDGVAEDYADEYVEKMCDKMKNFNVEDTYIAGFKAGYNLAFTIK